ncbi:UDP-glucose 4-epimerase GalE [Pantoea sp. B9002]|uniref:UDP-glucose 4-epimerase GalE n=1 Tax=Pantoea sp. B9002 TaxID=2726979 RepID=UPI0015A0B99A|nr:UDP-glucose 4-epimerase GalE [Pantoea sp. B9002]NWA62467.1 UDP-glucose 4-epimerase GalE [Pantoea sp. B9002]
MNVLITGGAGYIGSHIALSLLQKNHHVIVLDNLCNSSPLALTRVEALSGKKITFHQGDIRHRADLNQIFNQQTIDAVIHMAGLKSVNESLQKPVKYYQNNIAGTLTLLETMKQHQVKKLIFSSSATVYGIPVKIPLCENCDTGNTTNPYGASKYMVEKIMGEVVDAQPELAITALRYFNPAGAHPSGQIGEHPEGIPNNLLPYLFQVANGLRSNLPVFGDDYATPDGTGVRDYIHVMDLAEGHIQALNHLKPGYRHYNLGTGQGYSVLEIVQMFEQVSGRRVPLDMRPRRPGDVAICLSDPGQAKKELGWQATRDLEDMLRDAWRWHTQNPQGYVAQPAGSEIL